MVARPGGGLRPAPGPDPSLRRRPGASGRRLVYSTCTFNKKENEGNVEGFLREQPGFCLEGEPRRLLPHRVEGEGQFFARFRRWQEGKGTGLQLLRHDGAERSYWEFSQRFLSLPWQGPLLRQGEWLYGVGEDMPDLRGLRVLRAGLQLGRFRPGRFEPAHALALRARPNAFCQAVELDGERPPPTCAAWRWSWKGRCRGGPWPAWTAGRWAGERPTTAC